MEKYVWRAATISIRNEHYRSAIWFWRKKRALLLRPFQWLFKCFFQAPETQYSREELKQEVLSDVDDFRVDFGNSVSDKEDGEESAPELESKKLELKNKGSLSKSDSNGDDGERWGAVGPASHLTASPSRLLSWERDFSNGDQQLEWATRSLPSLRQLPPLSDGGSFGGDGSGEASPAMYRPTT
nr:sulfoquinovosyl transferase SQD2-like [Ipomoea batatas]